METNEKTLQCRI